MVWTLISNAVSHATTHNGEDNLQTTVQNLQHMRRGLSHKIDPKIAICRSPVLETMGAKTQITRPDQSHRSR